MSDVLTIFTEPIVTPDGTEAGADITVSVQRDDVILSAAAKDLRAI